MAVLQQSLAENYPYPGYNYLENKEIEPLHLVDF